MEIKLLGKKTNDKRFVAYGSSDEWKCVKCGKEIEEGYYCEDNGIYCPECHIEEWDLDKKVTYKKTMTKHPYNTLDEHHHLKILRIKDKDYFDSLNDVRFYDET